MERRERKGHEHVQPATHDCHNKGTPETDTRPSKKQNTRLVYIIGLCSYHRLIYRRGGARCLVRGRGLGPACPTMQCHDMRRAPVQPTAPGHVVVHAVKNRMIRPAFLYRTCFMTSIVREPPYRAVLLHSLRVHCAIDPTVAY